MKTRPYFKTQGKPKIEKGTLLIAQPFWPEEVYEHSAILILEHGIQGTTGVMLNKRSNLNVSDALPDLDSSQSLLFGGSNDLKTVCYLHTNPHVPGSCYISANLYWGGDYDIIKALMNEKKFGPEEIKFYAGLVEWNTGQLEYEIWNNKWWLGSINSEELFTISDKDLWAIKLLATGHLYGLLNEVPDPSLN
jgi:putative transcriptional regulator